MCQLTKIDGLILKINKYKEAHMTSTTNTVSLKLLLPLLGAIMALSPLAIDMYMPAMPILAKYLSTDMPMVQNSLSIYLFGYALGLSLFGPMADKNSRRKMVIIGISGFVLGSIFLPLSSNVEQFLTLRFIQAFISSAAIVVVPSIIREYYKKDTAKGLSYVSMIMTIAPIIAPTIGSALLLSHSWQMIFYAQSFYGVIILFIVIKYLPEAIRDNTKQYAKISFLSRYKFVFSNREARLDIFSSMIISLAFFSYLTSIPFVYLNVYKVSEFYFSTLFSASMLVIICSQFVNTRLVVRKGSRKMLAYGVICAFISAVILLIVNYLSLPLVYTVLSILPLMGGVSMVSLNSDSLVLTKFPEHSGTATGIIGIARFGIGSLAGPILAYFYDGSALPFAVLMLSAVSVVIVCQLKIKINKKAKL